MTHIFKRIQGRQRPEPRYQTGEHASKPVQPESKVQIAGQMEHDKALLRSLQHTQYGNDRSQDHQKLQKEISFLFRQMQQRHQRSAQNRQNHRKDQICTVHMPPPLTSPDASSSRRSRSGAGNMPKSTAAAVKSTMGTVMRRHGSFFSSLP